LNDVVDLAIQVATASDTLPDGSQPILPNRDTSVCSATMLKEDKLAISLEDAPDLP
jgi:hypothetical protein